MNTRNIKRKNVWLILENLPSNATNLIDITHTSQEAIRSEMLKLSKEGFMPIITPDLAKSI